MNFNYELLRAFKMVAYHNSISKAASVLCVTQPSVSKSIKKLEEEMECQLFIRSKNGMKLTESGKVLYNYISDAMNTIEKSTQILSNLNNINSGTLKIGASLSFSKYLLVDSIILFKKRYPNVSITIRNYNSATLYSELKLGNLDVIFVNSTMHIGNSYVKNKITDIEDCFFCSNNYYKKIKNIDNMEKFILKNIIVQNMGFDTRNFFTQTCLKNNIKFEPVLEVDRNSILVDFVLNDLGVGFATKQFIQEYIDSNKIKIIDTKFKLGKRYVMEVHKNNYNKKLDMFLNIVKDLESKKNN